MYSVGLLALVDQPVPAATADRYPIFGDLPRPVDWDLEGNLVEVRTY
jgi:hypothetical protein